jgi:hypothetical protein
MDPKPAACRERDGKEMTGAGKVFPLLLSEETAIELLAVSKAKNVTFPNQSDISLCRGGFRVQLSAAVGSPFPHLSLPL